MLMTKYDSSQPICSALAIIIEATLTAIFYPIFKLLELLTFIGILFIGGVGMAMAGCLFVIGTAFELFLCLFRR